jgi:hypothetical protein
MASAGTSFEPLLERYIGHKVVLELAKGDKIFEYCGVLKEYTAEFIEIMDVNYASKLGQPARNESFIFPKTARSGRFSYETKIFSRKIIMPGLTGNGWAMPGEMLLCRLVRR